MDWAKVLLGLGLFLVFEGLAPFLVPSQWKEGVKRIAAMTDGQVRFVGFISLLIGSVVLLLAT